ncbi:MAG: DUF3857 domain-containing protein [Terriglobales bacterium]
MRLVNPRMYLISLVVFALLFCPGMAAQDAAPRPRPVETARKDKPEPSAKKDLSKEAIIIESLRTNLRLESDGTGSKRWYVRMKVQSESGVQQAGTVELGYDTGFENIAIDYVRVIKPDGSRVVATTDSIQDLPSPIQRTAPHYTDFRSKVISVPGLRPGDILEYAARTIVHSPMIPGHFFGEYTFAKTGVVLEERFELDVPVERALKTHFDAEFQPAIQIEGQRRKYLWIHSVEKIPDGDSEAQEDDGELAVPDIQFSTFQDWADVAKWYADLQAPRAAPNDAIRKKAEELTAGAKTQQEKVRAIYDYVSTSIRYLGLSFGIGRYQPHAASEILVNQYGDCKDKHTLLTALLDVIGVKAEPVLISSVRKLDATVPSPLQFDHLITAIPLQSAFVYADTTTEVAQLGTLIKPLRGKQALRIGPSGEASIVKTGAEPPQLSREVSRMEGTIDQAGDLHLKVTFAAQGDAEIVWRLLLRRTPESQWPQLLKASLARLGLEGDISNIVSSGASYLNKPFELKFEVTKKKYTTVTNGTKLKLPIIDLAVRPAATPEQKKGPIRLGVQEISNHLRLELPKGLTVTPPRAVTSKQDFVEYESHSRTEKNIVFVERTYRVKTDEVPRARFEDYNTVYNAIKADQEELAYLYEPGWTWSASKPTPAAVSPDAHFAEDLVAAARSALRSGDFTQGRTLLEKATNRYPNNADAWAMLGTLYIRLRSMDKATGALQKAVELDPKQADGWHNLGLAYLQAGKYFEAAHAFARELELAPDVQGVHGILGLCLVASNRPEQAIEHLTKALEEESPDAPYEQVLAKAYFLTNQQDKGLQQVNSVLSRELSLTRRAELAAMLAEVHQSPELAEQQAQLALSAAYEKLQQAPDVKLADEPDLQRAWKLSAIWNSVGWVYFHHGQLSRAQRYLEAAWSWSQDLTIADRLAQLYLKQGRQQDAIRVWAQAFGGAMTKTPVAAWQRFVANAGDEKKADALVAQRRLDLQELRTVQVPNPKKLSGSGEFYISVGPGSKIEAADQYDGDGYLAHMSDELRKLRLELPFPDEQPIHVLRAGILSCFKSSPTCMFVLVPAAPGQGFNADF